MSSELSLEEVAKHNDPASCWLIIHGSVYDVTEFLLQHPGGSQTLLQSAGTDATSAYDSVHHPLLVSQHLTAIGTCPSSSLIKTSPPTTTLSPLSKPPLHSHLSTHDFTHTASLHLSPKAWSFASSAATDCITHIQLNPNVFSLITLRPRILRDVTACDISTTILGCRTEAPFFIAPMAMQRLFHQEGEREMSRGAAGAGLIQGVSTSSSFPLDEIIATAVEGQGHWLQLYVNKNREKTVTLLQEAAKLGYKAILVTVDAPVMGKREADERVLLDGTISSGTSGQKGQNDKRGGGIGRIMGQYVDASLRWEDLRWIKVAAGGLPVVVKGVQTAADVMEATRRGVEGVYLSNHGGRSLDTSPPAIMTLLEIHKTCPEVLGKVKIFVDGGVKRGTDIFKALCLGATGVGVGRPFLYALNYGKKGVEHLADILKDELQTTMRMCGVTKLSELHPGLLNTAAIDHLIPGGENHEWITWRRKEKSRL